MRLHPRTLIVQGAHLKLSNALLEIVQSEGLTPIEAVGILLQDAARWQMYALRAERHPEDPERKADEE